MVLIRGQNICFYGKLSGNYRQILILSGLLTVGHVFLSSKGSIISKFSDPSVAHLVMLASCSFIFSVAGICKDVQLYPR